MVNTFLRQKMKARIYMKTGIVENGKYAGRINLVKYQGQTIPHLEFEIEPEFRNKGLMSRFLPKYLAKCKKLEIFRLMALVKHGNLASEKVLAKSKFIRFAELEGKSAWIIAMDLNDAVSKFGKSILKNLKNENSLHY